MKIRTGFVSNSSSSSYVVAFNKEHPDVRTFMTHVMTCGTEYGEATSLDWYSSSSYDFKNKWINYHKDWKDNMDEFERWDYNFAEFRVDWHDDFTKGMLESLRDNEYMKGVFMIWNGD